MGCTQISIDDYRFPDSKRGGASCAEKLETNKYRTSSSVTGLSGPCRLRCESKGRSRSRTSRLLRERTCKKIMEQQCAKPLKWLQLTLWTQLLRTLGWVSGKKTEKHFHLWQMSYWTTEEKLSDTTSSLHLTIMGWTAANYEHNNVFPGDPNICAPGEDVADLNRC
ncbi:hypothetical protein PF004_g7700 [Phytophthora fragariae]|uniref:Uncharacterized protein n=1 Tax=Phytophthora fragariae TaxID=53985 RepID=A0A6A3F327_9STRA|nr:hypothetical protein PF009_g10300 [Phytophthora fragariae]KAE9239988.1 hypothetical protein PF004_g7700 [Phytophthora fragariae]